MADRKTTTTEMLQTETRSGHLHTLSGGLSVGAGEGDHAFVHLDAHHHALLFDQLGEELAVVCLLVESLMEEDNPADAGVDPVLGGEEKLAVKPPVLLRVLCVDVLEALGHAAWRGQEKAEGWSERYGRFLMKRYCLNVFIPAYGCNN